MANAAFCRAPSKQVNNLSGCLWHNNNPQQRQPENGLTRFGKTNRQHNTPFIRFQAAIRKSKTPHHL
ncbi:hypothetical protein [Kingella oralis]|uniref:hypothetical protein n=1 Tax=Kingella oralis TaxID=505 RepID=UPI002D7F70E1|nr:hypothetical protein [Kingella oralis]